MDSIRREGHGSLKVLLVPPLFGENFRIFSNYLPDKWFLRFTLFRIEPEPTTANGRFDTSEITALCSRIIQEENIDAIYADHKLGNIIKANLVKRFSHLKGPTLHSVAVASHRYYVSKLVDSNEKAFPKMLVNIKSDVFDTSLELLGSFQLPYMFKTCLTNYNTSYCCFNKDEVICDLESIQKDLATVLDEQRHLLESSDDLSDLPELLKPVIMLSPYMQLFESTIGSGFASVYIEAAVYDEEIIAWAIADNVTLPRDSKQPVYQLSGLEMPTKLTDEEQNLLWSRFAIDINNLIKTGFDNSFVHANYMIFEDGFIELTTINTFPQFRCTQMYSNALQDGNNILAAFELSCGRRPNTPKPKSTAAKHTLMHDLVIILVEGQVEELIDFERAAALPEVALKFKSKHEVLLSPAHLVRSLGFITVSADTFEDCLAHVQHIRKTIVKLPQLVPL